MVIRRIRAKGTPTNCAGGEGAGLSGNFAISGSHDRRDGPAVMGANTFSSQLCTDSSSNPVLNNSGEYTQYVSVPNVALREYGTHFDYASVLKTGQALTIWFSGGINNLSGVFTATSANGVDWNVRSAPVLSSGPNGTWDSGIVYSPDVLWNGSLYFMYYVATGTNAFRQIGVAFSTDNVNWVKYPNNPILVGGPGYYDSWWTRFPSVLFDNGTYKMWYTGHTLTNTGQPWYIAIDYATSADGVHWTKFAGNPVYGGGSSWPNFFFRHPCVLKVTGTFVMVSDNSYQVSYATCPDGIKWTQSKAILVNPTMPSGWDNGSASFSAALLNGSKVIIWYTGGIQNTHKSYFTGIGMASCGFLLIPTIQTETVKSITTTVATTSATVTLATTQTIVSTTEESVGMPLYLQNATLAAAAILAASTAVLAALRLAGRRP